MSKVETQYVVEIIGQRQRRRFEIDGTMNAGSSVDELAFELNVTPNTVRAHLREADRRGFNLQKRNRGPVLHAVTSKPISGRPTIEYYIVDGHRWAGLDKPRAHVVPVGAGAPVGRMSVVAALRAGTLDGMSGKAIRLALLAEESAGVGTSAMTDGERLEACSLAAVDC